LCVLALFSIIFISQSLFRVAVLTLFIFSDAE